MKTSESVAKFMFLFHEKVKEKNALYIKQLIKNLIGIVMNRMEDIIDKIEPFYRIDLMRVKKKNDLDNSMFVLELLRKTSRKWFYEWILPLYFRIRELG